MEIRKAAIPPWHEPAEAVIPIFCFLFSMGFFAAGCGVPGEPVPPSPPVPVAVNDLAVRQLGDGALLTFTPPGKTTRGQRLAEMPTLEILRGTLRPGGTPDEKSFRVVDTVPGTLLRDYVQQGKVRFLEPISPEETKAHPGETVVFRVRMRISERKSSAASNDVSLRLYPVPERIGQVETRVTEASIQLRWSAPARTSADQPLTGIQEYHVYRGELDPASVAAAEKDFRAARWRVPLLQIATASAAEYQDTGFDFGKTYAYVVRSAVNPNGGLLESGDSAAAIVTPEDTFPPAAPQNLVAAVLAGATPGSSIVDLSWAINVETDLAGYRIYRSEREGERGQLLTPELLPTPTYRDNSAQSGRRYWYTVTAVDHVGNESSPSTNVLVEIP